MTLTFKDQSTHLNNKSVAIKQLLLIEMLFKISEFWKKTQKKKKSMHFTTEQRVFVASTCYETKSVAVKKTSRAKIFPEEIAQLSFIQRDDTSLNLSKKYSGRKRFFRTS